MGGPITRGHSFRRARGASGRAPPRRRLSAVFNLILALCSAFALGFGRARRGLSRELDGDSRASSAPRVRQFVFPETTASPTGVGSTTTTHCVEAVKRSPVLDHPFEDVMYFSGVAAATVERGGGILSADGGVATGGAERALEAIQG